MKRKLLALSLSTVFNLSYAVDLDIKNISPSDWEKLSKGQEQQERDFERNPNIKKPQNIQQIAKDYFNKDYEQYTISHSYYSQKQKLNGYITCFVNENNESESIFTVDNVVMAGTLEFPETKPFSKAFCGLLKRYENERNITVPKIIKQSLPVIQQEVKAIEKPVEQNIAPEALFIKDFGVFTDIKKLVKEISVLDEKDEFTKQSLIDEKFNQFYVGKEYLFKDDKEIPFYYSGNNTKYDPEQEMLTLEIASSSDSFTLSAKPIDLSNPEGRNKYLYERDKHYVCLTNEKTSSGQYVGSNAFGVRVNVNSSTYMQHCLLIGNKVEKNSFGPQFVIYLHVVPNEARELKNNIGYYYKTEIVQPEDFKDKVIKGIRGSSATIDNPTSLYVEQRLIMVKIKEIGIFNKKTGQVLFIRKYNN